MNNVWNFLHSDTKKEGHKKKDDKDREKKKKLKRADKRESDLESVQPQIVI